MVLQKKDFSSGEPSFFLQENMSKQDLRRAMLQYRKSLTVENIMRHSLEVQQGLLHSDVWQKARTVALYMAKKDEVQTAALLQNAWKEGKKVYLPKCREHATGEMDFMACTSMEEIQRGAYGIYEPKASPSTSPQSVLKAQDGVWPLDVLLVPGVAFDFCGYRVGFGGGYYDRFLSALTGQKTRCLGVAFRWQMVQNIPHDAWDMPIHGLVSEEGLIWI